MLFAYCRATETKPKDDHPKEQYPPVWRGHVAMALQELSKFAANAYAVSGDVSHLQQVQLTVVMDSMIFFCGNALSHYLIGITRYNTLVHSV